MKEIKSLRAITGAGILDCKSALVESNGDIDKAIEILRKRGLSKAAKKSSRRASEGYISLAFADGRYGMVELNCETDFVARNQDFKDATQKLAQHLMSSNLKSVEELLSSDLDDLKVEEHLKHLISKFGENIVIGSAFSSLTDGLFEGYIHSNGKLAVVVEGEGDRVVAKDVAMHIAAMSPSFLDKSSVDSETLDKEREIYRAELESSGKPAAVIDRIVEGKINKYYEQACLLNQKFVKDSSLSVEEYIEGKFKIFSFRRYVLGAC